MWRTVEAPSADFVAAGHPERAQDERDTVRMIQTLFGGRSKGPVQALVPKNKHEEACVLALEAPFLRANAHESSKTAQHHIVALVREQDRQLQYLAEAAVRSRGAHTIVAHHSMLERLLVAAYELGGCVPASFYEAYAEASVECLPTALLLERIDNGLLRVTSTLLARLCALRVPERDPELYYRVLCHVPDAAAWDYFASPLPPFMIAHFLSNNANVFYPQSTRASSNTAAAAAASSNNGGGGSSNNSNTNSSAAGGAGSGNGQGESDAGKATSSDGQPRLKLPDGSDLVPLSLLIDSLAAPSDQELKRAQERGELVPPTVKIYKRVFEQVKSFNVQYADVRMPRLRRSITAAPQAPAATTTEDE